MTAPVPTATALGSVGNGVTDHALQVAVVVAISTLLAALFAQGLAGFIQSRIKQAEFDRLDSGIRRSLKALVSQVDRYVALARKHGTLDYPALREALNNMNARIYGWDVAAALTDGQAEALYDMAEQAEVCVRFLVSYGYHEPDKFEGAELEKVKQRTSTVFKSCCEKLLHFWGTMGIEKERLKYLRELVQDELDGKPFPFL